MTAKRDVDLKRLESPFHQKFMERMTILLNERKMTVGQIAAYAGMNPMTLRSCFYHHNNLNLENTAKLAAYFQVSVDWLIGRTDVRAVNGGGTSCN
jgi:hypothetical protein